MADKFTFDGGHQIKPHGGGWSDGGTVFPEFDKQVVDAIFNQRTIGSKVCTVMVESLNIVLVQPGKRVFIATAKQIPKGFVIGADLCTRASHSREGISRG